jgi:hypothetical protein
VSAYMPSDEEFARVIRRILVACIGKAEQAVKDGKPKEVIDWVQTAGDIMNEARRMRHYQKEDSE